MKARLYSTVSAAALIAVAGPAYADKDFSGVAQLYIGGGTAESTFFIGDLYADPFLYGGKAQGYWTLSPDVHLQVDLFAQQTDDVFEGGEASSETDASRFGGALHLLHPLENRARLGVAGSVWTTDVGVLEDGVTFLSGGDATYGLFAVEGQFFVDNWTLSGQAGVFTAFSCDGGGEFGCAGVIEDGTFLRGKIRYFLNDNTQLSLEGLQMWGGVDDDLFGGKSVRANSSHWTLEGEHRFKDSPFSAFLSLSHQNDEINSFLTSSTDTQTVSIGVKFYLDQATLKSNDRSGAAMDTPQFGNAIERSVGGAFFVSP